MSKIAVSSAVSDGKVAIPDEVQREGILQTEGQIERRVTESGTIEIRRARWSLAELVKLLPSPARVLTVEEFDEAIGEHLVEKHRVRR